MAFESGGLDVRATTFADITTSASRVKVRSRVKRVLDVTLASVGLVFLLPLVIPIALAIRLHDGGPALFVQSRIGRDGKMFRCFKFRSMVVDADVRLANLLASDPQARAEWATNQKLRKDPRITRLGAFLRKSSLDELPQLLNIIRGDMSIVGPRPIVESEAVKYGPYFTYYKGTKPGLQNCESPSLK